MREPDPLPVPGRTTSKPKKSRKGKLAKIVKK